VDRFGGSVRFDVDETGSRVSVVIPPELVVAGEDETASIAT
jgi:hypothetical protein